MSAEFSGGEKIKIEKYPASPTISMSNATVDDLLRDQLIGAVIECSVSNSANGLSAMHPFSWDRIMENPKGTTLHIDNPATYLMRMLVYS